jgi:capsular polysaccharide biosynthesis protein
MMPKTRSRRTATNLKSLVLAPPAADDVIQILRAWRVWLVAAVFGGLLAAALYAVAPPPYRGRATVNVDFHLERAWPQNTDREQFYYLERETRKLLEIAFSDAVLEQVATSTAGADIDELRSGQLQLSQPGHGGWDFYADDHEPHKAASLANAWADGFVERVRTQVIGQSDGGLEPFITVDLVRQESIASARTQSLGAYLLTGAIALMAAAALVLLFFRYRK